MSSAVHHAIANQFAPPEYATFFEVRDATGFRASRSADAITMSLWPSRGLTITGFEVKLSRSDWLAEKRNPAKSAPIQQYTDYWYIAVPNDTIVHREELPQTWGLKILQGKRLVTKVEAPRLEAKPLSKDFVATLLRRATEDVIHKSVFSEQLQAAIEDRLKSHVTHDSLRLKSVEEHLRTLREQVNQFEKASGIQIQDYRGSHKIGTAVRLLLESDGTFKTRLEGFQYQLQTLLSTTNQALEELTTLESPHQYPPRRRKSVTPG